MEEKLEILYIGETAGVMSQLEQIDIPGVTVAVRSNALEAVRYLMSGKIPGAILCDNTIRGGEDVVEMYQFVRHQLGMYKPAFILVSDFFSEDLYVRAFHNRMDDFLVFPLESVKHLVERIRFILRYKKGIKKERSADKPVRNYKMPLSKRVFDVVLASASLVLLSPFLAVVIVAISLESKGKFYYTSKRVGREPFDFYKFRSMRLNAENELSNLAVKLNKYAHQETSEHVDFTIPCPRCSSLNGSGPCSPVLHIGTNSICEYWYLYQKHRADKHKAAFIKLKDDPRITRVGKLIRNLSIDELPQLINVIKGDMSLVGNRPLPVYEAEKLTMDQMAKRFLAPAGLTGLWQVELRGKKGVMSEEERKKLDNDYADIFLQHRYTLWYDLKLILRTIPALFQKETV